VTLAEVLSVIEGRVISADVDVSQEVSMACGADLMSDVLAFTHAGTLLLTGLTNPQVVRTAEMAGIVAIVFVRGSTRQAAPSRDHHLGSKERHSASRLEVYDV